MRGTLSRWLAKSVAKLRRRLRGRRNRLRVQLVERSQQPAPTLIFLNVHRGASSFVAQWLAPAIAVSLPDTRHVEYHKELSTGFSPSDLPIAPSGMVVSRVYPAHYNGLVEEPPPAAGRYGDKVLVMVRRDPRDVAVSLYYSWAFSHRAPLDLRARDRFYARREELLELEVPDAILRYSAWSAVRQFLLCRDFLETYPTTLVLPYEQLTTDFSSWMSALGERMVWMPSGSQRLAELLVPELRPPKKENPYSHKRRITSGGWREHFDDRLRRFFEERAGAELERAGYCW